ncbi:regulatory protein RecX [Rathayibacter sp. YIM 133350]|uniref:regulatory protein RecX n=1 Tax=Rathayibacter sp. YIM 133350 TaxID=3131992 RepID=UPI00307D7D71
MTEQSGERLAPVSYLPWAAPSGVRAPRTRQSFGGGKPPWGARAGRDSAADDAVLDGEGDEASVGESAPADPQARALEAENRLTRALRARSLSAAEAIDVLYESDIDPADAQEIHDRFLSYGYLDDHRLAEQIVHTHHERKGLGRSAVETEMRRRRIAEATIAAVIDELEVDDEGSAQSLAADRIRRLSSLDDETAERRLIGFLMRKGYSMSVARAAVRTAFAEAGRSRR